LKKIRAASMALTMNLDLERKIEEVASKEMKLEADKAKWHRKWFKV
jgi:hypothetical protein